MLKSARPGAIKFSVLFAALTDGPQRVMTMCNFRSDRHSGSPLRQQALFVIFDRSIWRTTASSAGAFCLFLPSHYIKFLLLFTRKPALIHPLLIPVHCGRLWLEAGCPALGLQPGFQQLSVNTLVTSARGSSITQKVVFWKADEHEKEHKPALRAHNISYRPLSSSFHLATSSLCFPS